MSQIKVAEFNLIFILLRKRKRKRKTWWGSKSKYVLLEIPNRETQTTNLKLKHTTSPTMTTFLLSSSSLSTINRIPYSIKSFVHHPLNNTSLHYHSKTRLSSSSSCHTTIKTTTTIKALLSQQQYPKIGAQTIGPLPSDQLLQGVQLAANTGAQVHSPPNSIYFSIFSNGFVL